MEPAFAPGDMALVVARTALEATMSIGHEIDMLIKKRMAARKRIQSADRSQANEAKSILHAFMAVFDYDKDKQAWHRMEWRGCKIEYDTILDRLHVYTDKSWYLFWLEHDGGEYWANGSDAVWAWIKTDWPQILKMMLAEATREIESEADAKEARNQVGLLNVAGEGKS